MERIRAIALRNGSSSLAVRSVERLNDAESEELTVLLDQMAAHYPHQALPDQTGDVWREAIERLAVKFTLQRVRDVLSDFLIAPGQKFFPHPSEIAEALEVCMANERAQFLKEHPWEPCDACMNGMVIEEHDGKRIAVRCQCWLNWKRHLPCEASI